MQGKGYLDNAVLIYLFLLICFVIVNMMGNFCVVDIIYLIALICAVLKYLMIMKECRK